MGYAKLSARPRHHAQDEAALAAFKKLPRAPEGEPRRDGRLTRALGSGSLNFYKTNTFNSYISTLYLQ